MSDTGDWRKTHEEMRGLVREIQACKPAWPAREGRVHGAKIAEYERKLRAHYGGGAAQAAARLRTFEALGYTDGQVEYILGGPSDGLYGDHRTTSGWVSPTGHVTVYRTHMVTREMDALHGHLAADGQTRIPVHGMAGDSDPHNKRLRKIYRWYQRATGGGCWYDNY